MIKQKDEHLREGAPVVLDFDVIRTVGLTKAIILLYLHANKEKYPAFYGSTLLSVLPLGRSTIYKAIEELVTDTYLARLIDHTTNPRVHKKYYILGQGFYKTFTKYT